MWIIIFLPAQKKLMSSENIFIGINEEQYDQLKDSLALITILVAGADGEIDEQELNWAEKLTHIRSYAEPEELNTFYGDVESGFEERLTELLNNLPTDLSSRESEIQTRLKGLNDIFACLPNSVAFQLYDSFTSFAKHIAKASGGFLRFGSISSEEKKWIGLDMIEPIILEIPEEEEDASEEESQID